MTGRRHLVDLEATSGQSTREGCPWRNSRRTAAGRGRGRHQEEHPNELLLTRSGRHLFVANANRNTVTVLETDGGRVAETLTAELGPEGLPGSTPNSLALTPDETMLFVANANINAVSVFDTRQIGRSRSLGFIPVGWYPTSVRVTPDGGHLLVANGKGVASRANRYGPQPGREPPPCVEEYIASLFHGTLSIIDLPDREEFSKRLGDFTARTYGCRPPTPRAPLDTSHPIPLRVGDPSPIRYCIYIVKENRTYDQVLGDLPEGNGDPSLCIFPEPVTPNHHKLARKFVLLDNFYVESEVSADGHEWSIAADATDYVEKMWPLSYGHNRGRKYAYPSEGRFRIAEPAGGYLWDRAQEAGVSYRSRPASLRGGTGTRGPHGARPRDCLGTRGVRGDEFRARGCRGRPPAQRGDLAVCARAGLGRSGPDSGRLRAGPRRGRRLVPPRRGFPPRQFRAKKSFRQVTHGVLCCLLRIGYARVTDNRTRCGRNSEEEDIL